MSEKYTFKIFLKKKNKYYSNGRKSSWSRTVDVIYHIESLYKDGLTDDDFEIHIYPVSRAIVWSPSLFMQSEKENIEKRATKREKENLEQELICLDMQLNNLTSQLNGVDKLETKIEEVKNKINTLKNNGE